MRILITGFEPFGGQTVNPSEALVRALAADPPPGLDLRAEILPCAFATMPASLQAAIARHSPDAVLGFGLAGGRRAISIERIGINVIDARIPDNEGAQPVDLPVIEGGPAAYFATIPVKAASARLAQAGVPVEVSQTAGTFVCNAALYLSLHLCGRLGIRAGFAHVPHLPESAPDGVFALGFAAMRHGGRLLLATIMEIEKDFRISAGAVS